MTIFPWEISGGVVSNTGQEELLRRIVQLEGDSTWASYREEWQPVVLAIVTDIDYEDDGDNVTVKTLLVDDTQGTTQDPGFDTLDGWEGKAFSIGGYKLRVNNLVVGMPINLKEGNDSGEPWLACLPIAVRGEVASSAAMSGETDRWEYSITTASGTIADCTNERENQNDATTYQGYARSVFPGSFTVKPIADGEEVFLHGGSFSVPNLVVCSS